MIPKIVGVALIAALSGVILSEAGCKTKKVFAAVSVVVMLLGLAGELGDIFGEILSFGEQTGVSPLAKSAVKIVGLGYVFGISSEVCEELGERGISTTLTLFSRIEMFLVTLPYIKEIIEMGIRLVK